MTIGFWIPLLLICCGCDQLQSKSFNPALPGYPESGRKQLILKKQLREISGLEWLGKNSLAAINDEQGKVFIIDAETGHFTSWPFGMKGDYEDLVKVGDYFYFLESNGHIHKVSATTRQEEAIFTGEFGKHAEFESIYYDEKINQLIIICKECGRDEENIMAFSFNLTQGQFVPKPLYILSLNRIRTLGKNSAIVFKPSAAAIHPLLHKLFILSSIGKILLQCSLDGVPEKVFHLNPDQFLQPEGLRFAPNGDMFISNEGGEGKATLEKFPYKP